MERMVLRVLMEVQEQAVFLVQVVLQEHQELQVLMEHLVLQE